MMTWVESLDIIQMEVKRIGKNFGSGAESFFALLRFYIWINIVVSIVVTLFLIVPVSLSKRDEPRVSFELTDIFTAEGYLQDSELFFGFYTNTNATLPTLWKHYGTEEGYFYTVAGSYVFYIVLSVIMIFRSYTLQYRDKTDSYSRQLVSRVFSGWEMSLDDHNAAQALRAKNIDQLQYILQKKERVKKSKWHRLGLGLSLFVLCGIFAGVGYSLYELVPFNQEHGKYVLPLVIQGIMLIYPVLQYGLSFIEKLTPTVRILMNVSRDFLLSIAMLGAVVVYWLTQTNDDSTCWETRIGQELYRLLVYFFIVIVLGNLVIEFLWFLLGQCGLKQKPEFSISGSTSYLIYSQLLTWVGFYYSPFLPLVQTLNLFCMFIIKDFISLRLICKASPKIWSNSRTKFFYQVLSILSLMLAIVPYSYVLTNLRHSRTCGPFVNLDSDYPLYAMDFLKNFFLFLPTVAGMVDMLALISCYYLHSLVSSKKKYAAVLKAELNLAKEENKEALNSMQ